jgi:hypothetical protein
LILALDQFHDQGLHAARFLQAVNLRDVRMVQRGEGLRLAFESGEALRILCERLRQHLDRHLAPEGGVSGAIDLAHSTGAEGGEDFVGTEADTGNERNELMSGTRRFCHREPRPT